jgi:hypothetical protein
MGFYGGLMGSNGISDWIYPLVNIQKTMERSTILLMGKSTIKDYPLVMTNSLLLNMAH